MAKNTGAHRLQKEYKAILKRKDHENFLACPDPDDLFKWHFVIFGLKDCPFENGIYHGQILFPKEYPQKPPGIVMITPSGRFIVNEQICMSYSNFHPELWNPLWGVSTIIIGTISFMNTDEITYGGVASSPEQKKIYAHESVPFNLRNKAFCDLFKDKL